MTMINEFNILHIDLVFLDEFTDVKFEYYRSNISDDEDSFFSIFTCYMTDQNQLSRNYEEITNFIATDFQSNLVSDFSRWNIYLVFVVSEKVGKDIKYKIENDKYFVRKIVFENSELGDCPILQFLNQHILCTDLFPFTNLDDSSRSISKPSNEQLSLSSLSSELINHNNHSNNTNHSILVKDWLNGKMEGLLNEV